MRGLFIPKNPSSTLEILLQKEFSSKITDESLQYEIDGTLFYFLPDQNFSQTIVAFFNDKGMQLPLSKKIITSEFGYRTSPISGKWKFHAGIDLAAPVGTEVFACKHGLVAASSENHEVYGKYIDIRHDNATVSRYAHLSKIMVKKGERVSTGQTIGLVGTTGMSTGPHLHFEVRENGTPQDPLKAIKNP
ncbi:MAG: M23 family metallopeptidase [Treponema sp.]|nr:M23 family metallopeptidase [Treponema sp.]